MDTRPPERADEAHAESPGDASGDVEEPPPILGSWRALYGAVIVELLLVIALCQWLTRRGR